MANDWKSKADKSRLSISKFVLEHVENSLKQEEENKKSYVSRAELLKQLKEKDDEIVKLKQDNRLLKMLADNLDKELKKYRAKPFAEDKGKFRGVREYDRELIQLLRENETIDSDHLLKDLGISPRDTDLVKAVNNQLRSLQAYGLVEPTARGWRWTG
jgi:uncharacterized protein YjiS (DUF1127 family)